MTSTEHSDHSEVVSNSIYDDIDNYDTNNTKLKIRSTFFTLNNPTETDFNCLMSLVHNKLESRYIIFQKEVGENGTEHYQGFMYFHNQIALGTLNKAIPRAHLMKPRNIKACILYCKKERTRIDGPWELGKIPEQGRRTDLESIAKRFIETDIKTFVDEHPMEYVRFTKGLHSLKNVITKHRTEPPTVYWYWGPSGLGKTRTCYEAHIESVYMKDGSQWWDGYEQQEAIIIDDFDGKWPFRDLLRLLDRYPYAGQIKGGYVKINSPFIYITCEYEPSNFWQDNDLAQVMRRLKGVRAFGESE